MRIRKDSVLRLAKEGAEVGMRLILSSRHPSQEIKSLLPYLHTRRVFRVLDRKDSKLLLKSEAAFWDLNSSGEIFLYDKVIEYICIVMSMLIQRTDQEILMSFVASCIEDVADKLNLDYAEVYERMKVVGMIENYIIPHYNVLHTESRENVTAGMIDTLKRWEGQK